MFRGVPCLLRNMIVPLTLFKTASVLPSHVFPFHLLSYPNYPTGFSFFIFPVIFISLSSSNNRQWRQESKIALRKLHFHFLSNWMGYDRDDSFPFDFESNGIPFGSKSKGKPSPRLYPIQCGRKWKCSFLSANDRCRIQQKHIMRVGICYIYIYIYIIYVYL